MKYIARINDQEFEISIEGENQIVVDGETYSIDFRSVGGQAVFSLILDGRSFEALVQPSPEGTQVLLQGHLFPVQVEDERQRRLRESTTSKAAETGIIYLKSPMPGLIVSVQVQVGQLVERGQNLVILESMKMQNELKAPRAGTIEQVRIKHGDRVEQNQILLTMD